MSKTAGEMLNLRLHNHCTNSRKMLEALGRASVIKNQTEIRHVILTGAWAIVEAFVESMRIHDDVLRSMVSKSLKESVEVLVLGELGLVEKK